jgi:hypothetical protein
MNKVLYVHTHNFVKPACYGSRPEKPWRSNTALPVCTVRCTAFDIALPVFNFRLEG